LSFNRFSLIKTTSKKASRNWVFFFCIPLQKNGTKKFNQSVPSKPKNFAPPPFRILPSLKTDPTGASSFCFSLILSFALTLSLPLSRSLSLSLSLSPNHTCRILIFLLRRKLITESHQNDSTITTANKDTISSRSGKKKDSHSQRITGKYQWNTMLL